MDTLTFKITGLDCPNCTARIEKVIGKVKGVKSVNINFMTGKTTVVIERNRGEVEEEIEAAVKKAEPKAKFVKM